MALGLFPNLLIKNRTKQLEASLQAREGTTCYLDLTREAQLPVSPQLFSWSPRCPYRGVGGSSLSSPGRRHHLQVLRDPAETHTGAPDKLQVRWDLSTRAASPRARERNSEAGVTPLKKSRFAFPIGPRTAFLLRVREESQGDPFAHLFLHPMARPAALADLASGTPHLCCMHFWRQQSPLLLPR